MEGTAITCDICGRSKQETNHWLVAITRPSFEGILFLPAEAVESPKAPGYVYQDLCGQACSLTRHNRWLDDFKSSTTTKESETA